MKKAFPLGGSYLKHAPIRHHTDHTITGSVPLSIHAHHALINEICIYGNSIDSIGVGDKTINLADMAHVVKSTGSNARYNGRTDECYTLDSGISRISYIPCSIEAGKTYYVGLISERISGTLPLKMFIRSTADSMNQYMNLSGSFTANFNADYFCLYVDNPSSATPERIKISKVIVCKGSAAQEFVPFGYMLPVCITDSFSHETVNLKYYMPAQLSAATDTFTIIDVGLGFNAPVIDVMTQTPPSSISVKYTS